MIFRQYIRLIFIYNVLLFGLYAESLPERRRGFSLRGLMDIFQPLMRSGVSRCETLKNIFGITYDQMVAKNSSFQEQLLEFDHVTETGNVKYNMTSQKLKKLMRDAENIVIFVHGFLESSEGMMVQAMAPEFFKQKGLRLFALDGRRVITLEYFRASTYAWFMGELLGTYLSDLIKDGQDASKIHLIGHSLGSHISGRAGKQVLDTTGKLLGRITGLDPAGPCFSTAGPDGRLDKTDAAYVDIIHTNGGMLGLTDPVGHKDFYPNGGKSQPGCFLYICDHSKSWEFFTESINAPKAFPARKCENWTMYKEDKCNKHEVAHMGYHSAKGTPGMYFLTTGASSPFSLGPTGSG